MSVKLTPPLHPCDLQPTALARFEREIARLNDSYWMLRTTAALATLDRSSSERLTHLLPETLSKHLDVTIAELDALVPAAERQARYAMLVLAITAYEEYLVAELTSFLANTVQPDKQYSVKVRLADMLTPPPIDYLRELIVATEVRSIVNGNYEKRSTDLSKLLTKHGAALPKLPQLDADRVALACEVRNCIVHSGGRADARALSALQPLFPTIAIGDELELDEATQWSLLGSLLASVRSIHEAIHPVPRGTAKGRAASRKKKRNARNRNPGKTTPRRS